MVMVSSLLLGASNNNIRISWASSNVFKRRRIKCERDLFPIFLFIIIIIIISPFLYFFGILYEFPDLFGVLMFIEKLIHLVHTVDDFNVFVDLLL